MKKSILHRITELLAGIMLVVLSLCLAESFCESNFQGNVSTLGNGYVSAGTEAGGPGHRHW